ncbi:MAG: hypothetical protein H7Z16_10575 [Pyrinomonadaceae bacterium]|nr:hypothetical protein [Pyrinomonadaceae bacterium]
MTLADGIENLPFNEVTSKSIDTQFELSQTLFQIALLMTGALWGLVIAKKDEIKLVFSELSEVVMFLSSSVVLLLSVGSYGFYLWKVSHYFADASVAATKGGLGPYVPDIFDQDISYLFLCQIVSLVAGIFNGVLTLVSAHNLRE